MEWRLSRRRRFISMDQDGRNPNSFSRRRARLCHRKHASHHPIDAACVLAPPSPCGKGRRDVACAGEQGKGKVKLSAWSKATSTTSSWFRALAFAHSRSKELQRDPPPRCNNACAPAAMERRNPVERQIGCCGPHSSSSKSQRTVVHSHSPAVMDFRLSGIGRNDEAITSCADTSEFLLKSRSRPPRSTIAAARRSRPDATSESMSSRRVSPCLPQVVRVVNSVPSVMTTFIV